MEKMVQKMQQFSWPIYKIKLGTDRDVEIVRELRKHTNAIFRVDANGGWTKQEAIENSFKLKEFDVEFIEQPLPTSHLEEMREVRKKSALPVIADESCRIEADIEKCLGYFDGVNIKLTKCGGLTPARRMITKARKNGLKVWPDERS